jgi:hypothetical protein
MLIVNALSSVGVLSKNEEKNAVNQNSDVEVMREESTCFMVSSIIVKAGAMVIKIPKNKIITSFIGSQE